ncbi:unnamed protein product [Eruca vesicaria subsp. sativa]|uniref:Uncharacterized protein n=1 Tax=Eruca vesicaria subsp. sativa TaxID=29727 RepID=A0ABC8IVF9_ERUVS|nr:unnamed protein product [Eruca vesicaria subsp. sativa]
MLVIRDPIWKCVPWRKYFFFCPVAQEQIEPDPYINPLALFPADLVVARDLLRNGPFFWSSFTPRRVRKSLAHFLSGSWVAEDVDSDSDDPTPRHVPSRGTGAESFRGIRVDLGGIEFSVHDSVLPGWDPNLAFGDGSGSSDLSLPDFDRFFADFPAYLDPPPPAEG